MKIASCIGLIAAAVLWPAAHVAGQQSGGAMQSEIVALDKDAAQLRELADQASRRAADWDALAKAASDTAAKTTDPVIRKGWEDGAREHAKRAKEQRDEAARLTAQADAKAVETEQLRGTLAKAPGTPAPSTAPAGPAPLPVAQPTGTAVAGDQGGAARDALAANLEQLAAELRQHAAQLRDGAGRWREQAVHALAQSNREAQQSVKRMWAQRGDLFAGQGRKLDVKAERLERDAAAQEQLAAEQRRSGAADEPPLELYLGTWRFPDDNSEITIAQTDTVDPARKNRLTLTSKKNEWDGYFDPSPHPNPSRLLFSKEPKPAEMNKDIPQWARDKVAGALRWTLEMSEDQSCDIGLTAKWFPGEVTWSADPSDPAASASVTGKGKPIDLKYEKVAADDPWLARQPALFIRLADRAYSRHLPLTSISRAQPFLVEVVLSAKDAAAQGGELTVSLRASRSGGGDTVTLKGERNFSGAWEYRPESPIVLKPDAKFATMIVSDWLREYGHQNGNMDFVKEEPPGTLAFATENGDELVASYRDADGGAVSQMVVVFDNAVEQARDAIETQLDELTVLEQALLMGGRLNARQIKVAELRLRLIADGRALMAYGPGTFEHWPPSLLMALAAQFWVLAVDADPDMFFNSEIAPPDPPDEYGVSYFSRNERLVAHAVIDDVKSKAISDYFKSVDAELTDRVAYKAILSHYTGISVDDFNAAYYGVDQDGNLLETSDRVLAGIRVPLTLFVHWADAVGASGGAGATTAAGKIARFEEAATTSVLAAAAKSAGGAEEILLGVPAQAMAASGGLGHLLPSARIVSKSAKDAFFRQCNRYACALQSFAHAAYEAGAAFVPETLARGWAARQKIFNPLGGTTFAALREYASRFGARVGVAQLTLTEIKAFLDQGKFVLVGIRTTYGGAHALRMLNVIKSAAGQTLAVVFYDPGPGAIISMTACDFRQMRAGVSNTTFVFDFK